MPKLPADIASTVDETESTSFEPLPEGKYGAVLREVTVSDQPGKSGFHYWRWEFEVTDDEYKGRRQWTNTSLSPKAAFKFKEVFDAFGVPADTDTDELIGQPVTLVVVQKVIPSGSRAGETGNEVSRVLPAVDGGGEDGEDDDLF